MQARIAIGGEFLQLKGTGRRVSREREYCRGPVCGFSPKSRRRLFDLFASMDRRRSAPELFVTLTYSDLSYGLEWEAWKGHLQAMIRRLKRRYPSIAFVWRLEVKPRLTGDHAGELMPHFHFLVWNVDSIDVDWLRVSWSDVVGTGDTIRVNVRRVSGWRGACSYISKDMAKVEMSVIPTGRVWGVIGKAYLAIRIIAFDLTHDQFYRMRRVLRSWLRRRLGRCKITWAVHRGDGLTCYIPYGCGLRLLAWLVT
jgi:hypothetical protein